MVRPSHNWEGRDEQIRDLIQKGTKQEEIVRILREEGLVVR
jgi:arginine repressor